MLTLEFFPLHFVCFLEKSEGEVLQTSFKLSQKFKNLFLALTHFNRLNNSGSRVGFYLCPKLGKSHCTSGRLPGSLYWTMFEVGSGRWRTESYYALKISRPMTSLLNGGGHLLKPELFTSLLMVYYGPTQWKISLCSPNGFLAMTLIKHLNKYILTN